MTSRDAGHTEFDELAAGYVLHALEHADEQRFVRHAAGCPDCQRQIAGFQAVAAELAETAPAAEPSEDLGQRILAAVRPSPAGTEPAGTAPAGTAPASTEPASTEPASTEPAGTQAAAESTTAEPATLPPGVVRLRPRQQWLRRASVAAAAVLIVGGGVWGGLAATSGGTQAPLAMCARPNACPEVPLVATATHGVAAKVVVLRHEVWMVPDAMTANPANKIYVLWQITGSQAPRAVGSFDIRAGSHAPIRIGGLAAPYAGTSAFAVSLEHGRTIPAAPSNKLALGRVS